MKYIRSFINFRKSGVGFFKAIEGVYILMRIDRIVRSK